MPFKRGICRFPEIDRSCARNADREPSRSARALPTLCSTHTGSDRLSPGDTLASLSLSGPLVFGWLPQLTPRVGSHPGRRGSRARSPLRPGPAASQRAGTAGPTCRPTAATLKPTGYYRRYGYCGYTRAPEPKRAACSARRAHTAASSRHSHCSGSTHGTLSEHSPRSRGSP